MAIYFTTHEVKFLLKNKRKIVNWIKEVVFKNDRKIGDITIVFSNDNYILKINNQYLKHDYFTDIITFDYSTERKIEGDIFISLDTVLSNSIKYKTAFNNELLRVIIHGIFHLIGFKDKTDKEKEEMRKRESESLDLYFKSNE